MLTRELTLKLQEYCIYKVVLLITVICTCILNVIIIILSTNIPTSIG